MASVSTEALESLIAGETAVAVPELGRHWVEQFQQTPGVAAVLCYGSGLRETPADPDEMVFDFYLLVHRYRDFDPKRGLALAGALIPPNVYYREEKVGDRTLRCKFAVLTVSQFSAAARGRSFTPHIWARFCQPSRIVYTADEGLRRDLVAAMAESVLVFHRRTLHLIENCTLADFWRAGLHSTYADEIRSEKKGRMQSVFDANAAAYTARTRLALDLCSEMGRMVGSDTVHSDLPEFGKRIYRLRLRLKRPMTKGVVILRFIKAAFTFQGGLEYARWKLERHSGVRIEISDFQRRHPLLGGLYLFWKVMRQGGLR
jgi:hypothetical protein